MTIRARNTIGGPDMEPLEITPQELETWATLGILEGEPEGDEADLARYRASLGEPVEEPDAPAPAVDKRRTGAAVVGTPSTEDVK